MASQNVTIVRPPDTIDPADERWALVQRVLAGPQFARATHLRGFLLFVSERLITGRLSEINEYEIGRVVLGRRPTFNPHEDNIVRVQARHLRAKLEQYFETEGKDEPLVVTIPRGSYVPVFEARQPAESPGEVPVAAPQAASAPGLRMAVGLGLLVVTALVAAWTLRRPAQAVTLASRAGRNPLLARVFHTGDSTRIVISDASLVMLQEFLHRFVSLEEYLRGDYPRGLTHQPLNSSIEQTLMRDATRPYTSYGDIDAAHRFLGLSQQYQAQAVIRHPRHLHIRDLQTGSFVLLGGPLADPWYRLFENQLNFVFESDLGTGNAWIRNKVPRGGEQAIYSPGGEAEIEFAIIALVPNLRGTGNVLLLAGTAMEGTEAAGDMVIREQLPAALAGIVDHARNPEDSIEVLLQTHVVAGVPRDSKVVAWRLHPAGEQR
jgi:hypothetical protein